MVNERIIKKVDMRYFIKDISTVRSGVHFRSKIENAVDGSVSVIQLRDVDDAGKISSEHILKTDALNDMKVEYLNKGDVLFKAKSNRKVAAVFDEDFGLTVATVHYLVLKIKKKLALPEYVAWFLNHRKAQVYFGQNAEGSSFRSLSIIKKALLEKLEIDVPSIECQKKIIEISRLYEEEKNIEQELRQKKDLFIEEVLLKKVSQ